MKTAPAATDTNTHDVLNRVGHCLYRSEESAVYYAILKRAGKQIKRSLRTTDHALARRRLKELEDQARHLKPGEGGKITFADLAERWLASVGVGLKPSSLQQQKWIVSVLRPYFGAVLVRGITKATAEAWAAKRRQEVAARTYNHERNTLVRILNLAIRDGVILDNPARVLPLVKQPKNRIVIPSREQFKNMVEQVRGLRADAAASANLCELLAYSGCRLREGTAMLWGDVDFNAKQFTVTGGERGTKNHEVRVVPLFPALERFLLALRDSLLHPPQPSDRIVSIDSAKKAIGSACREAGLPHFTHHCLRHFFCSNAIEAGVDFKAIAAWVGHKDGGLLVAKTYGHLRDEHSTAMAQRMTFNMAGA